MLVLYGALWIAMKLLLITAAAVNLDEFHRALRTVQKTHTHTHTHIAWVTCLLKDNDSDPS